MDGVILVENINAPRDPLVPPNIPSYLAPNPPPLRRASDFLFVTWQNLCNTQRPNNPQACIKSLKWVIHKFVLNPSCNDAAEDTIGADPNSPLKWPPFPGYEFDIPIESDEPETDDDKTKRDNFNALVGCPNGSGIAFMLQQRQQVLGLMVIDRINLFGTDKLGLLCMAYHILPLSELPSGAGS